MTAKEYLGRLRILDLRIDQKIEELDMLRQRALGIGAAPAGERVQTSVTGDRLGDSVVRIVQLDTEINREIDQLCNEQHVMINQIQELSKVNYIRILYAMYVQYKEMGEIADSMGLSWQHTYALHKAALDEFSEIHKETLENQRTSA